MKISIITATYNSAATVERTIKSVLSQNYTDIEYLIIDGGSTDQTLEIVDKYRERLALVVTEPDQGLYDAMNKGIGQATGEVIAILNSDDFYSDDKVIAEVMAKLTDSTIDACYGDLAYFRAGAETKIVRTWVAGNYEVGKFNYGWVPPHPSFFVKKSVYDRLGGFRLDLPIAADFELMLRLILKNKISMEYIPRILVKMQAGGQSGGSFRKRLEGMRQLIKAWELNGLSVPFLFYFRPVFKLWQFFKK